jgi:hypothetical protein
MMKIFNKIMVNKIYFLIMGFLFSSGLFAATIHVNSSTGDDASGNGSSGSPYKTFHKAYTASSNSDVINLTGTFNWNDSDETGDVAGSGYTISKNITITVLGRELVRLLSKPTVPTIQLIVVFLKFQEQFI